MAKEAERQTLHPLVTCFDKYVLYETASFYYLIGCDSNETQYRILKLNRNAVKPKSLDEILVEDPVVYGGDELEALLEMINSGNKSTGGIKQVTVAYGLVGFVKFLDCYYFTLITQRKKVGCVGSNTIYAIKNCEMYAVRPTDNFGSEISLKSMWHKVNRKLTQTNRDTAESRYMGLFQFIDITKDFFFSYTYDLTHSLQHNFIMSSPDTFPKPPFKEMYEWNKYQTEDLKETLGDTNASLWTLPVIHGSFQQRRFSLFGRTVDLILMARRSRHYAGTRYLKRGVSVHGKVANDCEMEQIVQLDSGLQASFASYVQMRGSIPTYWYQETSVTMPKPPILVDRVDSNFLATQSHFADLIKRYSLPVIVLDLVKHHERRKRESIVGKDFRHATEIINISMPPEHQIRYIALDFSRISKSKGGSSKTKGGENKVKSNNINATGMEWSKIESSLGKEVAGDGNTSNKKQSGGVMRSKHSFSTSNPGGAAGAGRERGKVGSIGSKDEDMDDLEGDEDLDGQGVAPPPAGRGDVLRELDEISSCTLQETSIFCSTVKHLHALKEVDEHHKTKARQQGFVEQRGVLRTNCIDCLDRTNVAQFSMGVRFLTAALHSLGLLDRDTLDPSNGMLLGLMDMFSDMGDRLALQYGGSEAHKKVSKGSGKTKQGELLTSIKRYYSNAFTDRVKQDAMNVFLGFFQPFQHNYALWDLESDYFLHNKILYPPRPEINSILYDADNDRNKIDSDEFQLFLDELRRHKEGLFGKYLIRRKALTNDGHIGGGPGVDSEEEEKESQEEWWDLIEAREKMKRRLQGTKVAMKAAEEWWWRRALHQFESERQWMRLPAPRDMIPSVPYFDSVHDVNTLTFFDDELSTDYLRPIDATEARVFSGSKGIPALPDRDREELESVADSCADREEEGCRDMQQGAGRRVDAEGFTLNSFFQKAKSIVGDMLHPLSSESQDPLALGAGRLKASHSDCLDPSRGSDSRAPLLTSSQEMEVYAKSIQVDDSSQRRYIRYCDDSIEPEQYIEEKTCESQYDFYKSLHPLEVDYEDVGGMEELAVSAHIADVISTGQYEGMQQAESAQMATALLASTLVFVEPLLQVQDPNPFLPSPALSLQQQMEGIVPSAGASDGGGTGGGLVAGKKQQQAVSRSPSLPPPSSSSRSSSCSDGAPSITSAALSHAASPQKPPSFTGVSEKEKSLFTKRSSPVKYSVELTDQTKTKVGAIWDANANFSQAGLVEEIDSTLNKYMFGQHTYGQEVDPERLAKRLSSFTNDKDITLYQTQFGPESLVPDVDAIKFIAMDRATSYPLTELDSLLTKLSPLKKKYDALLAQKKQSSTHVGVSEKPISSAAAEVYSIHQQEADKVSTEVKEQREFDSLRVSSEEYAGFAKIGPDLYSKISNPCFICNESAVIFYTKYNAKKLKST